MSSLYGRTGRNVILEYMLLCGILVSTLLHDPDDRLITGQNPSYDGIVLNTGKVLELQQVQFRNLRALT